MLVKARFRIVGFKSFIEGLLLLMLVLLSRYLIRV